MRLIKLLLLLFLVAVIVTIAARIQLSEIIIGGILHRAGGDNVVLRISEIGLQRFKVDLLSCRFTGESGPIAFKLQNLSIHYQPGELIQGNLREAVINSLEVTLPSGKKESSTAFEPRNLHQFMNSRWRKTIPFQSLTIHEIVVHGKSATLLANKKLNFSMHADQGVIKGALTLSDKENAPVSLIAVSQDANHLAFSLGTKGHAPQKGLQLDLQATDQRVAVQFKLQLEQLGSIAEVVDLALPMVQGMVDGEISMDFAGNSQLAGKALLTPAGVPGEIQAVFNHDLNKGSGRAEIKTLKPLDFSGENITLSDLLTNLPLPFDLNQGQLQFSSIADWAKGRAPSLRTRLNLENGAGMVKHLVFTGLTTVQDLDLLPILRSRTEGTLTIDSLQGGIDAHTITAQTFVDPSPHGKLPLLRISSFSAHLFGGEASTDDLLYDLNQPASDFTVRLHGINLAEIMSTQPVKGLQLSGTIDGILPVTIKAKDISITSGKIHNKNSGGVIRYTPQVESALKQSALTGYALTALEEFHYDTLRASTTYSPDGLLEVNIQLQGKSPKLDTNRPVHLNVNTEQNILSLLQSLRYSKNLTDELGSKIQQHIKP